MLKSPQSHQSADGYTSGPNTPVSPSAGAQSLTSSNPLTKFMNLVRSFQNLINNFKADNQKIHDFSSSPIAYSRERYDALQALNEAQQTINTMSEDLATVKT